MTINTRKAWRPVLRPVARLLVVAQLALVLQPLSVLAQEAGTPAFNPAAQAQLQRFAAMNQTIEQAKANKNKSPADFVSDKLGQAQELVAQLKAPNTPDKPVRHQQLKDLLAAIQAGAADVRAEFAATRDELRAKNLPVEILARHDEAAGQFEQRAATFGSLISQAAGDEDRVAKLSEFFDNFPAKRKPGKTDPKKLPWSTPKPTTRMPAETQTAWYQNAYGDQKIRLAQAGGTNIGPLQFNIAPEPTQAPTLADLAETDEVQLTPAIRAKAAELGNNPVNIYNWVRNNIEFAPTAGAIQSAQDTLDKKRGNATDTASLLVALLRAAHIPARYQYGTIEVPAAQAMNWVGGATVPQAALQILNQGGIAARGMASGGRITAIRMEHVWVRAYVNWSPSRGNRNATPAQHPNPNGPLNAWVPLDASFKQYTFSPPMDLKSTVPPDVNALVAAATQGATTNAAQGWVQGLNHSALKAELDAYEARVKTYVSNSSTGVNSTAADLLGKQIIPVIAPSLLAGTTANHVIALGSQSSAVPSAQQHKFTYRLYASDAERADESPLLSYTEKVSKLAGRRVTLNYVAADDATASLIASYLPGPHADGSRIQPTEFSGSLPAYLIRLKAQISLDDAVVASSSQAIGMGTDLYSTGGFTHLHDPTQWDLTSEESNVAGQVTAIGISATGVGQGQLTRFKGELTRMQLELQDPSAVPGSVKAKQASGLLLASVIASWFAVSESSSRISQLHTGVVEYPGLSYGLFHAVVNPIISWGIVRSVSFPGVNLDIGHVRINTWSNDNDSKKWIQYNRMRGQYMSTLEAVVPERFFNDTVRCNLSGATAPLPGLPTCPQGISATKALASAAMQGQKVYTITQATYADNPSVLSTGLSAQSASIRERARQALEVGFEVTAHEAPVSQGGLWGSGIVIVDPTTGAGAYLIDGVSNGGSFETTADRVFVMLGFGSEPVVSAVQPALVAATSAVAGAYMALVNVFECNAQAIINVLLIALVVAAVIAAIILAGPAVGAAIAALIAAMAPASAFAAQENSCPKATCSAERTACFGTSLNDGVGGSPGSGRCQLCYETCMQLDGKWPSRSHTGDRCDYWNFN
ncbi:transglutaminase [Ramlibacter sp. WS9]|nr:transglutaminase [Ramlibacter sp. WS9]